MMQLKDATKIEGGLIRGAIFGDTRGRFNDGEYVITTVATEVIPGVYRTKNSTYQVEFAADAKTPAIAASGPYIAPDTDAA
jgi:hypothetical protein